MGLRRTRRWAALLGVVTVAWTTTLSAQEADLEGVGYELGDPTAPITVVEYADFACGACGQFARDTWPAVFEEFVEAGVVRWKLVAFELGFRNSDEGARIGECAADQGLFWEVHDLLFAEQSRWTGERRPKGALLAIAEGAPGLDPSALEQCYDKKGGRDRTRAANRAARTDRVRGTPTFFIDGFRVQGALPIEAFRALLEESPGGPSRR